MSLCPTVGDPVACAPKLAEPSEPMGKGGREPPSSEPGMSREGQQ